MSIVRLRVWAGVVRVTTVPVCARVVMMSVPFGEETGLLKSWTVGKEQAYAPQSFRQAGGMMHRTLRLADMLPMSVSLLSADTCIRSTGL